MSAKIAQSSGVFSVTDQIMTGVIRTLDIFNKAATPETAGELADKALELSWALAEQNNELDKAIVGTGKYYGIKRKIADLEEEQAEAIKKAGEVARAENEESLKAEQAHLKSQLKIKADAEALRAEQAKIALENEINAELDFYDKKEEFRLENERKTREATQKALADDAEMHGTFMQLKLDAEKKAAREKDQLDRNKRRSDKEGMTALSNVTSDLKSTLGEQSALYKAAAITEATINTYKSANAASSALAGIPYVGPALGAAAAGVAIGAGIANVNAIKSAREQGGNLSAGQGSTVAERDQVEVFIPSSNGKVKTANQLAAIGGGGSGGQNVSLTVIDQSGGEKEYSQEQRSDGEIILMIRNTVSGDIGTPNSKIDKSLSGRGNQRQRA
jgi:hypothetical protein